MLKNVFWLFVSQISRLLRVITLLYAARILGAGEYGTFSYILGMVGLFSIFADMGISPLLTRDAAGEPQRQKEYFATSFWIKIFLITLTSVIFFIFAPFFTKGQTAIYLIPLATFLIVFDNIRDFIVAYLRGLEKMERETLIVTILNITLTFFGFITLLYLPTAKDFFFAYVMSSVFATVVALIIARKVIFHIPSGFRKKIAKEILKNGWPIALSGTFGVLMLNIDIFMLGLWSTTVEIGLYSAGQKIIQVLYTVPALLASGTFPTMASIVKTGDTEREKNLSEKSISIVFLFTIPLVIGGIILAESIFKLLFGHEYVGGVSAFILLLLNTLFIFPGIMISNLVLAHNQQKKVFKYVIVASLTNVVLNSLLIPKIGIVGAAFATLVAQIINYGCAWLEIRKINNFKIFPHLKNIVVSAIFMGITSFILNTLEIHVLINIILSVFVYFAFLWIFKEKILKEIKSFIGSLRTAEINQEIIP